MRVGDRLEPIGGRSTIRDTRGKPTVDLAIDVAEAREGLHLDVGKCVAVDDEADVDLTHWGPLIKPASQNFEANAVGDQSSTSRHPGRV